MAARRGVQDNELRGIGLDAVGDVDDRGELVNPWWREIDQTLHHPSVVASLESYAPAAAGQPIEQRINALGITGAERAKARRRIHLAHQQVGRGAANMPRGIGYGLAEGIRE
jgi:hypothetical protein